MKDIKPQVHIICGRRVEISRTNGLWRAEPLDKDGPTGLMTGGPYETINEYLSAVTRSHAYNNAFYSGVPREEAKRLFHQ